MNVECIVLTLLYSKIENEYIEVGELVVLPEALAKELEAQGQVRPLNYTEEGVAELPDQEENELEPEGGSNGTSNEFD